MTVVDTPHGRRPQLRYLRGAACPADPHTQLSATVDFYCDHTVAGHGRPELRAVHEDCHYAFEWPTNVVCAEHSVDYRAGVCELFSNRTQRSFDLRRLGDDGQLGVSRRRTHDARIQIKTYASL